MIWRKPGLDFSQFLQGVDVFYAVIAGHESNGQPALSQETAGPQRSVQSRQSWPEGRREQGRGTWPPLMSGGGDGRSRRV